MKVYCHILDYCGASELMIQPTNDVFVNCHIKKERCEKFLYFLRKEQYFNIRVINLYVNSEFLIGR